MISKEDIFKDIEVDEIAEMFEGYLTENDKETFEFISDKMVDYDEGNVIYETVIKHKPTNRYFLYNRTFNSWADYYGEDFSVDEIEEVEPYEVVEIKYRPISNPKV